MNDELKEILLKAGVFGVVLLYFVSRDTNKLPENKEKFNNLVKTIISKSEDDKDTRVKKIQNVNKEGENASSIETKASYMARIFDAVKSILPSDDKQVFNVLMYKIIADEETTPEAKIYLLNMYKNGLYVNEQVRKGNYSLDNITCPLELITVYGTGSDATGAYDLPQGFTPYAIEKAKSHVGFACWPTDNLWSSFDGGFLDGYVGIKDVFKDLLHCVDDVRYGILNGDSKYAEFVKEPKISATCVSVDKGYTLCGIEEISVAPVGFQFLKSYEGCGGVFEDTIMYPKDILDPETVTIYPKENANYGRTTYFAIKDEVVDIVLNGQKLEQEIKAMYFDENLRRN